MTSVETRDAEGDATITAPRWFRRRPTPRALTLVALAMILVQTVLRGVWTSQSWFLVDDFLFMADIARGIDDTQWFLRLHNGHFMPLSFGLVKLVTTLGGPYPWALAAAEMIALQLVAALTCWWMLRTLFGNRPAILGGLAFYLFSPLTMTATMWWAVAINQLPHQIAFFGMLAAHVQYCRSRSRWWLAASAAFLTIGYLSYAKTPLIVITIVLVTLIWFSFGRPWDRFWIAVNRYRTAWVVYGVLSIVWLGVYLTREQTIDDRSPSGFLDLLQAMVLQTLVPTFSGGPWRWVEFVNGPIVYGSPPLLPTLLATLVLAGVVALAWGTRERSLRILWAVAAYVFVSALLIFTGRSFVLQVLGGEQVGRYLQYISDIVPIVCVAVVALFVPVVGALDPVRDRAEPLVRIRLPRPVLAAGAVALLASAIWSSQTYTTSWKEFGERTLTQRASAEIERERPLFADVGVPLAILSPLFGENSSIANYFSPLGDAVRTTTVGNDLQVLDGDGRLAPAGVRDPASADLDADPVPRGECLDVSTVGRWYTVVPPPSFGLWIAVDYRADDDTSVGRPAASTWSTGRAGTLTVEVGARTVEIPALQGRHRALLAVPVTNPTVHLTASDGLDLCVTSVRYGLVAAQVSP